MADPAFHIETPPIQNGASFAVVVDSAPCDPATVTFIANGTVIGSFSCAVGKGVSFTCPSGIAGRPWKVVVDCPSGEWAEKTGVIS